jgi:hypothetical protein
MTESRGLRVLESLHGKWEKDHDGEMAKYPLQCCYWETKDGKRVRRVEAHFADLVERFSEEDVNDAIDGLKSEGLIDLFDSGLDVYYMLTGKGVALVSALRRSVGSYWSREHTLNMDAEKHHG